MRPPPPIPNLGNIVAPMEPSQRQLSNDSFSYSWLLNLNPSLDSLDDGLRFSLDIQDGGSFIEMDPKLISMRWKDDSLDFDFTLPSSQSPVLVHADQIFSDGLLLPLHLITSSRENETASDSSMNSPVLIRSLSLDSSKSLLSGSNRFGSRYFYTVPCSPVSLNSSSLFGPVPVQKVPITSSVPSRSSKSMFSRGSSGKLHSFGDCTKSSKKFIQRYLSFLMPLYRKFKGLKLIRRAGSSRSCVESIGASSRASDIALSSFKYCDGRRTFDMGITENAINDAVLHCKNSFGKSSRPDSLMRSCLELGSVNAYPFSLWMVFHCFFLMKFGFLYNRDHYRRRQPKWMLRKEEESLLDITCCMRLFVAFDSYDVGY